MNGRGRFPPGTPSPDNASIPQCGGEIFGKETIFFCDGKSARKR
jgi:hypothetical protein